ncbi:MAG TPA: ATP-binding protein [Mycobacteriales bacterium]|jgi:anti-sigma regulatory factor (Ser/Thr protein kinase)|nr:ATP-binding protein [Mycobacteriales bacterium]
MATVELRFTPLPAHVRTARLLAAVLARRAGVDESLIDEVKLAVGEACARAVGLHQQHAPADDVVVEIRDDGGAFEIVVTDRGPHDADTAVAATGAAVADPPDLFDADELAGPSSEVGRALPPGFGLAVVAGLVDDLAVTSAETGTVVRMTWSPDAAAPPAEAD